MWYVAQLVSGCSPANHKIEQLQKEIKSTEAAAKVKASAISKVHHHAKHKFVFKASADDDDNKN